VKNDVIINTDSYEPIGYITILQKNLTVSAFHQP